MLLIHSSLFRLARWSADNGTSEDRESNFTKGTTVAGSQMSGESSRNASGASVLQFSLECDASGNFSSAPRHRPAAHIYSPVLLRL